MAASSRASLSLRSIRKVTCLIKNAPAAACAWLFSARLRFCVPERTHLTALGAVPCTHRPRRTRTAVMPKATPSKSVGSNSRGGTSGNKRGGGTSRQKARGASERTSGTSRVASAASNRDQKAGARGSAKASAKKSNLTARKSTAGAKKSGAATFGPGEGKGMQGWEPGRGKSKTPASRGQG